MDWPDMVYQLVYTMLCTSIACISVTGAMFLLCVIILKVMAGKVKSKQEDGVVTVGFFHPYCNAGGGGERVLWCAVRAVQTRYPAVKILVYTGDTDAAPDMILAKARDRFNMQIPNANLEFVYLHKRRYLFYPAIN